MYRFHVVLIFLGGGVRGGVEGAVAMSTSKDCEVCFVTVKHIW